MVILRSPKLQLAQSGKVTEIIGKKILTNVLYNIGCNKYVTGT